VISGGTIVPAATAPRLTAAFTVPSTSSETEPVNENGFAVQLMLVWNRFSVLENLKGFRSFDEVLLNVFASCSAAGECHVSGPSGYQGKETWSMELLTLEYVAEEAAMVDVARRAVKPASAKPAALMYRWRVCVVSPVQALDGKVHTSVPIMLSQRQLTPMKIRFPKLTVMVKPPKSSYRASKSGPVRRSRG
jgi:hypothetical protein